MTLADIEDRIIAEYLSGKHQTITDLANFIYDRFPDLITRSGVSFKQDNLRRRISHLIERNLNKRSEGTTGLVAQKGRDLRRINNKVERESNRAINALTTFAESLLIEWQEHGNKLSKLNIKPLITDKSRQGVGVIQITDVHANELVDLPHNQYNWDVLSKRMKKLINESLSFFEYRKAKRVLIAFTGDLLNSDRRLDEILNQSTNRAKAAALLAHVLVQAILEVRNRGYEVDIVSVLGNESRVKQEMSFSNEAISDNYDFTIMAQVKHVLEFSKIKGINFLSIDKMENIVQLEGQNWLITHDVGQVTNKQKDTQSVIGKYALQGVMIDFVIAGHIHANRATDISGRSGSMVGSNSYNEHALGLTGRASGLCYYVKGKERYYQYIDLQYAKNDGYNIVEEMKSYNVKSDLKARPVATILKVVV